jgi:hypothetical protein
MSRGFKCKLDDDRVCETVSVNNMISLTTFEMDRRFVEKIATSQANNPARFGSKFGKALVRKD